MRTLIPVLFLTACGTEKTDDTSPDDTNGGEETGTSQETGVEETGAEDTGTTEETGVELGTEIFTESFETPTLTLADYTEDTVQNWFVEYNLAPKVTAVAGVYHIQVGLDDLSPLAAPADVNQALYFNTGAGGWARVTREIVGAMTEGTTYTMTGAIAIRNDVGAPGLMSVNFTNSSDVGVFDAAETNLWDLIDEEVTGQFQTFTVSYTATADDVGDPLSLRLAAYHVDPALSQILFDNLAVYESE